MRRALAHLRHRAGGRGQLIGIDSLYRVDHRNIGLICLQRGENFFQANFSQHLDLGVEQPQAARTQRHLRAALLPRHVQGFLTAALQRIQRLQQQGRFADAGVAADQHDAALDDAATQDAVQLVVTCRRALHIDRVNVAQSRHFSSFGQGGEAVFGRLRALGDRLNQRIPGVAAGAFAQPLGGGAAAFGADVNSFFFSHGIIILYKTTDTGLFLPHAIRYKIYSYLGHKYAG